MSDLLGKRFWRKDGKYKAVSKMLIMKNHFCDSYDNNRPVENRFKSKVTSFWVWFILILDDSPKNFFLGSQKNIYDLHPTWSLSIPCMQKKKSPIFI